MQSEPVLILGALLAALPSLSAALLPVTGAYHQIVAGVLSALGVAIAFYLRSKVTPNAPAPALAAKKLPSIPPVVGGLLAFLLVSCTPAQAQIATTAVTVAEATCIAIASVEAPAAEPICVGADELAKAAIAWAQAHGGAQPPITTTSSGVAVVPADLHAALAALPSVKARKVTKRQACAPGTVAP